MSSMTSTRTDSAMKAEERQQGRVALDPSSLLGTWVTTNSASRGIVRVNLAVKEGAFTVQIFGACEPTPCDWGEVEGPLFADGFDSPLGTNFGAFYDFGFMNVRLQGYVKQGVLVIVSFNRFKDGSGRSNYFGKEFFFKVGATGESE